MEEITRMETCVCDPPLQEASVRLPVSKARPAHHHVLQQAQVGHLVLAAGVVEQHRGLHLVGFYASHIIRLLKGKEIKGSL